MSLIGKLKSMLGLGGSDVEAHDVGVTVEHDPSTETEAAVKGVEEDAAGAEAGPSVEDAGETTGAAPEGEAAPENEGDEPADVADEEGDAPEVDELEDVSGEAKDEELEDVSGEVEEDEAEDVSGETEDDEATEGGDGTADSADETDEGDEGADETVEGADESEGEPVVDIKGIGSVYADRLAEAGVESIADLAERDPADLAEETGIAEGRLETWIERARHRS